jgi:hypothetical protein
MPAGKDGRGVDGPRQARPRETAGKLVEVGSDPIGVPSVGVLYDSILLVSILEQPSL